MGWAWGLLPQLRRNIASDQSYTSRIHTCLTHALGREVPDIETPAHAPAGRQWQIRFGAFLVPLSHAAGQNVVNVIGLRFLTDNLAIAAGIAGAMFAATKIYDAFTDPMIGGWSDRAQTRWGRRLPFLFAGGLAMPVGLAVLFGTPDFESILMAQAMVMLALIIHATSYTLLTIPGFAMLIEASTDHKERTRLMSWRVYGNAIGTFVGTTMAAWLLADFGADRAGHFAMALIVGGIIFAASMLAVWCLRNAPRTKPAKGKEQFGSIWHQLSTAWANLPFRLLAIAHIFLLFGTAIGSASFAYFSRYVLQVGDGVLGNYFLVATIAMVGSMPIWVKLSDKIGKKTCYMAAMMIFGVAHLTWMLSAPGEAEWLIYARAGFNGFAGGGMILCAYALLSDAVRYDFVQNGMRREGSFAGITTLLDKLSAAAALAVMGIFLSTMGYVSSDLGAGVSQPTGALDAVRFCTALFPALAMVGAIIAVFSYKLDPDALKEAEEART